MHQIPRERRQLARGAVLAAVLLALTAGGSATATMLITSADIRDGTIQERDLGAGVTAALKASKRGLTDVHVTRGGGSASFCDPGYVAVSMVRVDQGTPFLDDAGRPIGWGLPTGDESDPGYHTDFWLVCAR